MGLRVLVADFQRDMTSSGVTPGNGVALEGLTAIHHRRCHGTSHGVLSGFPLSTVYFVLLEIQYTFIFSLSSPHFTTRTEPTKTHGSSMRHNRSWVLYEILSMATNCNRSAVSLLLQMTRSSE